MVGGRCRGGAKAFDPRHDLARAGLERGAVDDQPRADLGDRLDLDQPVFGERPPGRNEVDDAVAEAEHRGQLHGPVQFYAFGLDPAAGEMGLRHVRIFGRDADVAPRPRVVGRRLRGGFGDRDPAASDAEIDRRVDLRKVELHQHVVAGDAELRAAEGDEGGDVERADADQRHAGQVGRELQRAAVFVAKRLFGNDSGARQHRQRLLQDPPLGQRDDQLVGHDPAVTAPALRGKRGAATGKA